MGKFKGQYHITINTSIPPVIHPLRKFPVGIKDGIMAEIHEMVKIQVIMPVTELTDWVSSLAYSQKANGR